MGPYYNTITIILLYYYTIILLYYYTIILLAAWSAVTAFTTTSCRECDVYVYVYMYAYIYMFILICQYICKKILNTGIY